MALCLEIERLQGLPLPWRCSGLLSYVGAGLGEA